MKASLYWKLIVLVLILVVGCNGNSEETDQTEDKTGLGFEKLDFDGQIVEKFDIEMHLEFEGRDVSGYYEYIHLGETRYIYGTIEPDCTMVLTATDDEGNPKDIFRGKLTGNIFEGKRSNPDGSLNMKFLLEADMGIKKLVIESKSVDFGEEELLQVEGRYPRLKRYEVEKVSTDFNQTIQKLIRNRIDEYRPQTGSGKPPVLKVDYEMLGNGDDFFSLILSFTYEEENEPPIVSYQGFTWSAFLNDNMALEDVFEQSGLNSEELMGKIIAKINEEVGSAEGCEWKSAVFFPPAALGPKGLSFRFDTNTLGKFECGNPKVDLSWEEVGIEYQSLKFGQ